MFVLMKFAIVIVALVMAVVNNYIHGAFLALSEKYGYKPTTRSYVITGCVLAFLAITSFLTPFGVPEILALFALSIAMFVFKATRRCSAHVALLLAFNNSMLFTFGLIPYIVFNLSDYQKKLVSRF